MLADSGNPALFDALGSGPAVELRCMVLLAEFDIFGIY
jgi:hypothetical protein